MGETREAQALPPISKADSWMGSSIRPAIVEMPVARRAGTSETKTHDQTGGHEEAKQPNGPAVIWAFFERQPPK